MSKSMIVLSLALFSMSCQKTLRDVEDYFPIVKTISATVQADGSVLVEAEIESEGAAPLEFIGFSCGSISGHPITERQIIVDTIINGKFRAVYSGGFEDAAVYYFKAWATNSYGYALGNELSLTGIIGTPTTPPCTLAMNWVSMANSIPSGTFASVSEPIPGTLATWEIRATPWDGPGVNLLFGSVLTTGVYTTTIHNSPGPGQVQVSFYWDFIYGALNSGAQVLVNKTGPGTYEINICDAPWEYNGSLRYFKCRMVSPS